MNAARPSPTFYASDGQACLPMKWACHLANIGTSWYVWLEQGRDVHPSAEVMESLAQALRLTPNERRHLFLLAGQTFQPSLPPTEENISPAFQRMLDDLNPSPAYILGRRYDYLAWNRAADGLFSISDVIADASSPYARNMIWRLFTSSTASSLNSFV